MAPPGSAMLVGAGAVLPGQHHVNNMLRIKSVKNNTVFQRLFRIFISLIIISLTVYTYVNIKIEKYHGRNHINKN